MKRAYVQLKDQNLGYIDYHIIYVATQVNRYTEIVLRGGMIERGYTTKSDIDHITKSHFNLLTSSDDLNGCR